MLKTRTMAYPKERNPAKKTKCPHCNWTGSARGLFGHVRMKHQGMEELLNIRSENPYVVEKTKALGSVKSKIHRTDIKTQVFVIGMIKLFEEYMKMDDNLFPSRSSKLNPRK
jgi:hypothetical protein